jgi:branched-chain amino acid transport system permease protein
MFELLGITAQGLVAQLLVGLINGSFYAVLSLGLAIIFGLLHIVNFAHGAFFMMGAFLAWLGAYAVGGWIGQPDWGLSYFAALLIVPLLVAAFGVLVERLMLRRVYALDPLYGLLLTFGMALVLEGLFRHWFGISSRRYELPEMLAGSVRIEALDLTLPRYRVWAVGAATTACLLVWWLVERTKLGALLRAGTQNPKLLQSFGVNVPLMITLTYALGVALAAFAGVLAAPIYQVSPMMGANLITVVFAVVVIGGIGSIGGAIATGLGLGAIEGLTRVFYPEASSVVIFVVMAIVLLLRPAGLFGKDLR